MSVAEYIGAKISLISRSDIRYVGTLHSINQADSTIALENVHSFGTEGRKSDPDEEIPASAAVFEYILFRAADVKDLHVDEKAPEPPQRSEVPNDPAIISSSSRPPRTPQEPHPSELETSKDILPANLTPRDNSGASRSPTSPQKGTPHESGAVAHADNSKRGTAGLPPKPVAEISNANMHRGPTDGNRDNANTTRRKEGEFDAPRARLPGMGGHLLNSRRGRGGRRYEGPNNNGARAPLPNADFDFEGSNAKFSKNELVKEVSEKTREGGSKEEDNATIESEATVEPAEEVVIPPPAEVYYNKASFFDNISCETKERQQATEDGRQQGGGRAKQFEERRLNLETFGQMSIDRGRGHRRGFRGRGGYRGGYHGGNGFGNGGGFTHNSGRGGGHQGFYNQGRNEVNADRPKYP